MPSAAPRINRWILAILLLGLSLRLVLFLAGPVSHLDRALDGDSSRYMVLADTWLGTGTFGLEQEERNESSPVKPFHELRLERGEVPPRINGLLPELFRTPGYPAFLTIFRAAHAPWQAALVVQILLSIAAAGLVFILAQRWLTDTRAAMIASALMALTPADIIASNMLLTESLYSALFIAAMAFLFSSRNGRITWPIAAVAAVALGAAALVRPVGLLIGPAIGAWLILSRRTRTGFAAGAAVAAVSMLLPAAWMCRNAAEGGGFHFTNVSTVHLAKTAAMMEMRLSGQTRYPQDFTPHYTAFIQQVAAEIRPDETVDARHSASLSPACPRAAQGLSLGAGQ